MTWTLIGSSGGTTAAGTGSENETLPGTPAIGDIVLVAVACDNTLNADGVAGGQGYTDIIRPADTSPGRNLAYKVLTAADTTVTINQEAGAIQAWVIQVWRGVDDTVLDVATPSEATGTSGDPNSPSITPVTPEALVFTIGFQDDDDSTLTTVPSGYTNSQLQNTGAGSTTVGATVMIASKQLNTPAAENPAAWAVSGDDAWGATTIALRPRMYKEFAAGTKEPIFHPTQVVSY